MAVGVSQIGTRVLCHGKAQRFEITSRSRFGSLCCRGLKVAATLRLAERVSQVGTRLFSRAASPVSLNYTTQHLRSRGRIEASPGRGEGTAKGARSAPLQLAVDTSSSRKRLKGPLPNVASIIASAATKSIRDLCSRQQIELGLHARQAPSFAGGKESADAKGCS